MVMEGWRRVTWCGEKTKSPHQE